MFLVSQDRRFAEASFLTEKRESFQVCRKGDGILVRSVDLGVGVISFENVCYQVALASPYIIGRETAIA